MVLKLILSTQFYDLDPAKFNQGEKAVRVLLEGIFPSNYENRVSQEMADGLRGLSIEYKPPSIPTRMFVISDGDVAAGYVRTDPVSGARQWLPLGFRYRFEKFTYANKDFMLNAINTSFSRTE